MAVCELGRLHCLAEYDGKSYVVFGGTECGRYRLDIVEYKGIEYNIIWTKRYKNYGELEKGYNKIKEFMG